MSKFKRKLGYRQTRVLTMLADEVDLRVTIRIGP